MASKDEKNNAVADITDIFDKYNELTLRKRLEEICSSDDAEKHMTRREKLMERNDRNSEEWLKDYNKFTLDMLLLEMSEEEAIKFLEEADKRVNEFDEMIRELPEDLRKEEMAKLAELVASKIIDDSPESILKNDFIMHDKIV